MSFENFAKDIEQLSTLPTVEKTEDGYKYPAELIGKLAVFNSKLILFGESIYDEIALPLVETIYEGIERAVVEDVKVAISESVDLPELEKLITDATYELQLVLDTAVNRIEELETITTNTSDSLSIAMQIIEDLQVKKSTITIETIQKLIESKLDSSPARVGKIKISTLGMLKESGFSIDEISELAKNDLI